MFGPQLRTLPDYISPPPDSAQDERTWGRLAHRMNHWHSKFRLQFKDLMRMADQVDPSPKYPNGRYALVQVLAVGEKLCANLDLHHRLEETDIFPIYGLKMPQFMDDQEHLASHALIHAGVDKLSAYLASCRANPLVYSAVDLRAVMDSFHDPLFNHLDREVENLHPDVLRRYYTLAEVQRLPV